MPPPIDSPCLPLSPAERDVNQTREQVQWLRGWECVIYGTVRRTPYRKKKGRTLPSHGLFDTQDAERILLPAADDGEGDKTPPRRLAERLQPIAHIELVVDIGQMEVNGPFADKKILGDLFTGSALDDEGQDFDLPRG